MTALGLGLGLSFSYNKSFGTGGNPLVLNNQHYLELYETSNITPLNLYNTNNLYYWSKFK